VKTVRHASRARIAAMGLATSGALLLAGCGAANETAAPPASGAGGEGAASVSGTISGAGASSQQAAMEAWIAGFTAVSPDATINYDPSGSGAGRDQFTGGGVAFAGSDAALDDEELPLAQQRCGGPDGVIELPVYISPIAVVYKLDGVAELNLSPATVAGIFNRQITTWNDPAIAADNPGATLPATAITPVNRSDESGTTENFTEYLVAAAGPAWPYEADGAWPVQGGEAAQGTSGVVGAVGGGQGTIGYADASQAKGLGVAKIKVGSECVAPTADAAAAVVAASPRVEGRGANNFAIELDRDTTTAGSYPIVLVSYDIACATYPDQATADLVKGFLGYVISEDGQKAANGAAGSAPITAEQRSEYEAAVEAISASS
jgi:phosphate transport system substrate-binding protein